MKNAPASLTEALQSVNDFKISVGDLVTNAKRKYDDKQKSYKPWTDQSRTDRIIDRVQCSGSVTTLDRQRLHLLKKPPGLRRKLRWLAVEAGANIPYVMTAINLVTLVLLFTVEWLPSGEVPYTWTTVLPAVAAGLVSSAYHFAAGSSRALKLSSLVGNGVTLLLLVAAIIYPKRTCCGSVPQGQACPPRPDLLPLPGPPEAKGEAQEGVA